MGVALALVGAAAPAAAQTADAIGFRAFGHYEIVNLTASKTFDAVLDTTSMTGVGGGGEVLRIWKGLFVRGAVSQMKDTGSRAFVFGNDIIPVDIPLEVKMRTVELAAGWRFPVGTRDRIALYAAGGALLLKYDETSDFAAAGENVNESFNGFVFIGGAEFTVWKWIFAGVEGQYRSVPDAIGSAGISDVFNETNLGGTAVRVLFGVRR
jgi:hypothetical protein